MKDYIKGVATQATAIILAALGAAAFAFFQSAASSAGICPAQTASVEEVGLLGALFKGIHSAILLGRGTMS